MTDLVLIRHGPTEWNASGRVQGHTDIPLSMEGRARVRAWRVPAELAPFERWASPLLRARETAEILAPDGVPIRFDARLKEMHWGDWEGETLATLRARYGEAMIRNESRGLDFRAPGAESPRDVRMRVIAWCAERASAGRPALAVAHKGVLRVVMAAALDWDMTGAPPVEMEWDGAHHFALDGRGMPRVVRLNIPLVP
jgi:probable phosphoglycerate mutase